MKPLVIYDGSCRFCAASVQRLRRLDLFGRLEYGNARDAELLARHPQIDPERALARLQLLVPGRDGVLEGFHALRWIAGRLPLLWIVWPLLWIPGVALVGVRVYDLVARNRYVFGSCEQGTCETGASGPAARDEGVSG